MNDKIKSIKIPKTTPSKFKGKTVISLFENGKVVKEHIDENMMTEALYEVLNPRRFVVGNETIESVYRNFLPIYEKALGGVLLYQDTIEENTSTTLAPINNVCVGHAGDNFGGSYKTRGVLNTTESGFINPDDKSAGYRFVWDFATDKANGTISCVGLTSTAGGNNGWGKGLNYTSGNDATWYVNRTNLTTTTASNGARIETGIDLSSSATNQTIRFMGTTDGIAKVGFIKAGVFHLCEVKTDSLVFNFYDDTAITINHYNIPSEMGSAGLTRHVFVTNGKYYIINRSGNNIVYCYWDDENKSFSAVTQLSLNPEISTYRGCLANGYWYFIGDTTEKGYRQVVRYNEYGGTGEVVGSVYYGTGTESSIYSNWSVMSDGTPVWIATANKVRYLTAFDKESGAVIYNRELTQTDSTNLLTMQVNPDDDKEFIGITMPLTNTEIRINGYMMPSYLATINNLSSPITKIESQTMKITYEIRPESEGEE